MQNQSLWKQFIRKTNFTLAWKRVQTNMGAPGIDRVSIDEFAVHADFHIETLRQSIGNDSYTPLPFLTFDQVKNNKKRTFHIPALRDRLVQYAILQVIEPFCEKIFTPASFAYRPGKSAIKAAEKIERWLRKGDTFFFHTDIQDFFESIDRTCLKNILQEFLQEDKLIHLMLLPVDAYKTHDGKGIPQGMILSPILSNLYLHPLDVSLQSNQWHYLRYADNLLILATDQEQKDKATQLLLSGLHPLKLKINDAKTKTGPVSNGFDFLGFRFSHEGKKPSLQSKQRLQQNLLELVQSADQWTQQKLNEKLDQIIRGWLNYFHIETTKDQNIFEKFNDLFEDTTLLGPAILRSALAIKAGDLLTAQEALNACHELIQSPDIMLQWAILCYALGRNYEARDCLLSALKENPEHPEAVLWAGIYFLADHQPEKAIRFLQKAVTLQPQQPFAHYALGLALQKFHLIGAAQKAFHQAIQLQPELKKLLKPKPTPKTEKNYSFTETDLKTLSELFLGRDDIFAIQWLNPAGRVGYQPQMRPLQLQDWHKHLLGQQTLGLYLIRSDMTAFHLVFDFDLTTKVRTEFIKDQKHLPDWIHLAFQFAYKLYNQLQFLKMPSYIEDSGLKGVHLWLFFSEPIRIKDLNQFASKMLQAIGNPPAGILCEFLPRSSTSDHNMGSLIKLPFGIHQASGRRCLFLDADGNPHQDWLYPLYAVEKISSNTFYANLQKLAKTATDASYTDFQLQDHHPLLAAIQKCNVLQHLYKKAQNENRLNHLQRLTFLGTIAFIEPYGHEALHAIMSHTLNYNFRITERWYQRRKGNPLSCHKIRLWHHDITPGLGCYCQFDLPKECYPSPIAHTGLSTCIDLLRKKQPQAKAKLPPSENTNASAQDHKNQAATTKDIEPTSEPAPANLGDAEVNVQDIEILIKQLLRLTNYENKLQKQRKTIENQLQSLFARMKCNQIKTSIGTVRCIKKNGHTSWILEI